MPTEDIQRQLQIKVNVLKRCQKEHESYQQEVLTQERRIVDLETNGAADESTLNKQRQVLGESQRMVPECATRVEQAKRDLKVFLERHPDQQNSHEALLS